MNRYQLKPIPDTTNFTYYSILVFMINKPTSSIDSIIGPSLISNYSTFFKNGIALSKMHDMRKSLKYVYKTNNF